MSRYAVEYQIELDSITEARTTTVEGEDPTDAMLGITGNIESHIPDYASANWIEIIKVEEVDYA